MRHTLPTLALAALAHPALAADVLDCDRWQANARNLAQPYDTATRDFANGEVSFLHLYTGEPACCGSWIMVLWPSPEGYRECRIVSREGESGFNDTDLMGATASYDPARGLTVDIPVRVYGGETSEPGRVSVTVNRATQEVTAE